MSDSISQSTKSKLKETLEKVTPGLRAYQKRLDQLSDDIRSTEIELKNANFNIPVRTLANTWTELGPDVVEDIEMGTNGPEFHFTEYLVWDNPDAKGFRLYYELCEQEGYVETDGPMLIARGTIGQPNLKERKALIDCKASKRLEMEPHLVRFIEDVGTKVDPTLAEEAEVKKKQREKELYDSLSELWEPKKRKAEEKAAIGKESAKLKVVTPPNTGGPNA